MKHKSLIQFCSVILCLLIYGIGLVIAQVQIPGRLDPTFGSNGKITTSIFNSSLCYDVATQKDGKIVCVGVTYDPNNSNINFNKRFAAVRYNTDGSLDKTFGDKGFALVSHNLGGVGRASTALSVSIQSDGKLVLAGFVEIANDIHSTLVRLNTDGSLDTSFGPDGRVITQFGFDSMIMSTAIQTDGKIVAAGYSDNEANKDFAVARYNTDGSLDTTFGSDGKISTPVSSSHDMAHDVAIQPDGKIIVGGLGSADSALVRYNSDGTLDNSFGTDGKVLVSIGSGISEVKALALQADEKIIVVGWARLTVGGLPLFSVSRFNTDGSFDNSFANNGRLITPMGNVGGGIAQTVAIQNNGKILVAGHSQPANNYTFAIARINSDGTLDTTFDSDGKVFTSFPTNAIGYASTILPNGKLIIAGTRLLNGNFEFAAAQYFTECSAENSCFLGNVRGRVLTPEGKPIYRAVLSTTTADGEVRYSFSNPFGYYQFKNLYVGDVLTFNVTAKGKTFQPVTLKLTNENINSLNFISDN